ncbi:ALP1-like protein [Tanacetum coccineum]
MHQSPLFNDLKDGKAPEVLFVANDVTNRWRSYLVGGIYQKWVTLVKSFSNSRDGDHKRIQIGRRPMGIRIGDDGCAMPVITSCGCGGRGPKGASGCGWRVTVSVAAGDGRGFGLEEYGEGQDAGWAGGVGLPAVAARGSVAERGAWYHGSSGAGWVEGSRRCFSEYREQAMRARREISMVWALMGWWSGFVESKLLVLKGGDGTIVGWVRTQSETSSQLKTGDTVLSQFQQKECVRLIRDTVLTDGDIARGGEAAGLCGVGVLRVKIEDKIREDMKNYTKVSYCAERPEGTMGHARAREQRPNRGGHPIDTVLPRSSRNRSASGAQAGHGGMTGYRGRPGSFWRSRLDKTSLDERTGLQMCVTHRPHLSASLMPVFQGKNISSTTGHTMTACLHTPHLGRFAERGGHDCLEPVQTGADEDQNASQDETSPAVTLWEHQISTVLDFSREQQITGRCTVYQQRLLCAGNPKAQLSCQRLPELFLSLSTDTLIFSTSYFHYS